MKIKRFIANNMRQALHCVRKEQGPDAVILSNRRVEGGIEVVAAVDYDETLMAPAQHSDALLSGSDLTSDTLKATEADSSLFGSIDDRMDLNQDELFYEEKPVSRARDGATYSDATSPAWSRESALGAIREEINGMRTLLADQLSSMAWSDEVRRDPTTVNILRRYAALGLDEDIGRRIVNQLDPESSELSCAQQAVQGLADALPMLSETILEDGGVVAVIGPTGVGKTTSIAKIAARFALKHGRDQVALVSTDSFRIGAQEQLATFAQILDVPVHRVTDKQELGTLLGTLSDKRLVLIDTAGVSQRVEGLSAHLSAFNSGNTKIHTYLALAANAHARTLDEVIRKFGCVPLDGCILTKIDEAACLGAVFSAVIRHRTPMAFLANGQRVPEDLHPAAGKNVAMVNYAMRLMRESGIKVSEEFMARHYGEVNTHVYA